jgi:hypothetical protein
MKRQHKQTIQALFSHPLQHNIRISDVEAMCESLKARVEHLSDNRLKLQLASGERIVIPAGEGKQHTVLDESSVMRIRKLLEEAGITPEHYEPANQGTQEDQTKYLVIHLDHRGAKLWWLRGNKIETTNLEPHGAWSTHQRLTNRHDRDIAGQRAPLDYEYLRHLSAAVAQSDRALLLGHGHGSSDMRNLLKAYLEEHHPNEQQKLEIGSLDDTAHTENELHRMAQEHFATNTNHKMK